MFGNARNMYTCDFNILEMTHNNFSRLLEKPHLSHWIELQITPHDFRTYYFRFLETFLYKLDFFTFPKVHFGPNLILGRTYVRRTSFSGSTVRWCILQLIKCCPASENPCLEQWLTEYVKGLQILMLRMGPCAREWARYLNTTFRFLRAHSAITRYCIGPVHRGYKP